MAGLLVLIVPAFSAADPAHSVSETLQRLVAANDGFGGGVVRISDGRGQVIEDVGGLAFPGQPMTPGVPFEIASITKAVTAAAVLRLVEQGRLRLDAPLSEALPAKDAAGFDARITIRQLLSHTSGLPHYWTAKPRDGSRSFLQEFIAEPNRDWTPAAILAHARGLKFREPGKRFEYSDTNYVLLGRIIEHTTGEKLHTVYRRLIFGPLGMNDTWLTYREPQRGRAPSHRYEGEEDLTNVPRQSADWAGGGLVSTSKDLEKFLRGLAGGLFQSASSWAVMRESVPTGDDDISYGLGLYRIQLDDGLGELWGHDGHGNSFAYYWPQRGITFTGTLNQTENDWWPLIEAYLTGEAPTAELGEAGETFSISLFTGWDSLYMDRGLNALSEEGRYGSGIQWVDLAFTMALTEDDYLTLDVWNAFSTGQIDYKEVSTSLEYTRLLGDFEASVRYSFTYGYGESSSYSNEVGANLAWNVEIGELSLTPSIDYLLTIGPDIDDGFGTARTGSGFLNFRLDVSHPLPWSFVALEPWFAFGLNFGYTTRGEDLNAFNGANNVEVGLAMPFQITSQVTLSIYGAYSHALTDLSGTDSDTFWGGASLGLEY